MFLAFYEIIKILMVLTGGSFFLAMIYIAIISFIEKEYRAVKISFLSAFFLLAVFYTPLIISFPYQQQVSVALLGITYLVMLVLFIPFNPKIKGGIPTPQNKIDERDVMFSRNELQPGTELYHNYYKDKPGIKELDNKFREKPGLLSEQSYFFHPYSFASAHANLEIIETLKPFIDGEISPEKEEINPDKITKYIKNWAKKLGAHSTGITMLKDYHLYSHKGRGNLYGKEIKNKHNFAIAITIEMDNDLVQTAPKGGVIMESTQQYLNIGTIALQIAYFIRKLGYSAKAHIDGNYEVICPLVARDAGLGEIGRMGLLMTPELGPRVRLAVITTEIPLKLNTNKNHPSVYDFCKICKKCADVCPSQSIPFDDRKEIDGVLRWQINSESCFTYWCFAGTDCGRCMAVCPYSHPNNFMHNFIRWGIKNSYIFRRFALFMDDIFYKRKPKSRKLPSWIDI